MMWMMIIDESEQAHPVTRTISLSKYRTILLSPTDDNLYAEEMLSVRWASTPLEVQTRTRRYDTF